MSYVALYRKYRSQSFGEVVGQEHVTRVLQNAIRGGRVAHAYLFCGPRGCGKTSSARLLARALNCQSGEDPTPDPCGTCDMCLRIRDGAAMDVIEMDAASETGIDDVREKIIENAKYAPGEARYKVYIIDEVHDLSLKAFDSLLKTIEEPPTHVVFILATTEAHKVPITVRSRCQRMDFRRGTLQDLVANVKRVLEAEGIAHEIEAVTAIARAAEGSFRDSLSLLEQALAYTDGTLTAAAVHASIGTIGPEMIDEAVRAVASDDLQAAFLKAGEIVDSGKDVKQALVALQAHLRDLLVARIAKSPQALPEVSSERFAQLKEQSGWFAPSQVLQMLDVLAEAERDIRFTNQHRLVLERALWSILPSSLAGASQATPAAAKPATSEPGAQPTKLTKPAAESTTDRKTASGVVPVRKEPPADEAKPSAPDEAAAGSSTEPQFAVEIDLDGIRRIWPRVLKRLTKEYQSAAAIFTEDVYVQDLDGKFVVLGFPNQFVLEKADRPARLAAVEKMLAAELGTAGLKVRCKLADAQPVEIQSALEEPAPFSFDGDAEGKTETSNGHRGNGITAEPPPVAIVSNNAASVEEDDFLRIVMAELDGRLVEEEG